MRVIEPIIRKGFFWKAGHEDQKVTGTLTIEDGGISELELIGSLTGEANIEQLLSTELESNFLIYGQIDKDNFTTLYNCHYKKKNYSITSNITTSIIRTRRILLGIASDEETPIIKYKSVHFELEEISSWVDISGFTLTIPHDNKRFRIDFDLPESIEANLQEVGKFKIEFNANYPITFKTEINSRQSTAFKLYPKKPITIEESIEIIAKLQHFVMLAMQNILTLKNVKAILHDEQDHNEQALQRTIVQWFYQSLPFQKPSETANSIDPLFTISDIKNDFESLLNKWFEIYKKCHPSIRLYFSAITGDHKYSESLYLSLSQAAETYQRTMSENKNLTFKQRIKELAAPFKHFIKFDLESFLETAKSTRNYLTHYNEEIKTKAASGISLYQINKILKDLLTLNLLRDIGFKNEEIEEIAKKSGLLHHDIN